MSTACTISCGLVCRTSAHVFRQVLSFSGTALKRKTIPIGHLRAQRSRKENIKSSSRSDRLIVGIPALMAA